MKTQNILVARVKSFGYAFKGIATLISTQANAWIHLLATIVVIIMGLVYNISPAEWCFLLLAMALVWISEGFNTALEFLTDLASPDHHPLAGKVKDVAAGAVLLAAMFAMVVGGVIFWPYIFH